MNTQALEQRLLEGLAGGRLAHAYILEGPKKWTEPVARRFAAALLCTGEGTKPCGHCPSCSNLAAGIEEDLVVLSAEASGKSGNLSLKDERVSALQERLKKKPLAAARVVAIITDADFLTERAQNRLLKTLEEPPGADALLLLSQNKAHLLPTIQSRCTAFTVDGTPEAEADTPALHLAKETLSKALTHKKYYEFLPLLEQAAEDKPAADAFLDALQEAIGETAKSNADKSAQTLQTLVTWASYAESCRADLARNVNVHYALKDLVLKLIEGEPL